MTLEKVVMAAEEDKVKGCSVGCEEIGGFGLSKISGEE